MAHPVAQQPPAGEQRAGRSTPLAAGLRAAIAPGSRRRLMSFFQPGPRRATCHTVTYRPVVSMCCRCQPELTTSRDVVTVVLHPGFEGGFYPAADARMISRREDRPRPIPCTAGGE